MRIVLLALTIIVSSASAYAQALDAPSSCWPLGTKGQVVVTRSDGSSVKDTLLCMSRDSVVLASGGTVPLDSVARIAKPRDGVIDGVLKGAGVGLLVLVLCAPDCGGAEPVVRITLGYAILGGVIDAAQGNNPTIYKKGASPSLAWRIRF
ncbi:MAG TPA: hypothetical protein VKB50_11015 [Vicinamibacterales bacterium]|nr:hypothetical protein [Vicinamibacterales bacterium]